MTARNNWITSTTYRIYYREGQRCSPTGEAIAKATYFFTREAAERWLKDWGMGAEMYVRPE